MDDPFNITRDDIRATVPPHILKVIDQINDDLVAKLGESPEAWRGCFEALDAIVAGPLITVREDGTDFPREAIATLLMLVLGQFLSDERVLLARALQKSAQAQQQKETQP